MKCFSNIQSAINKFIHNKKINAIITTLLLFSFLYIAIVTVLGESFLHPLKHHYVNYPNENWTVYSIFILFLLLCVGLVAVQLSQLLRIPMLFGCLVVGIVINNIEMLHDFFIIPTLLEVMIRKLALVNIVIRWGLATDAKFIYNNAIYPVSVGLISVIGEILAVTLASYVILKISFLISVFCALILVTVSPAVTVPAMISFKERNIGMSKRIPEHILAICCVDNLLCVIVFMVLSSLTFTDAPLGFTLYMNFGTIATGIFTGLFVGWLLWYFPRADVSHTQFTRISLLGLISTCFLIGSYLVKFSCSGFLAALILSSTVAIKWKADDFEKFRNVELTYKYIWESFALPLLFICLGLKFDLSTLSVKIVLLCLVVITIGLVVRTICILVVSIPSDLDMKEKLIVALSLLPRATFQADLAPTLVLLTASYPEYYDDSVLVLKAAIISVLVTAPVFDVLLNILGPKFLKKENVSTAKEDVERILMINKSFEKKQSTSKYTTSAH